MVLAKTLISLALPWLLQILVTIYAYQDVLPQMQLRLNLYILIIILDYHQKSLKLIWLLVEHISCFILFLQFVSITMSIRHINELTAY